MDYYEVLVCVKSDWHSFSLVGSSFFICPPSSVLPFSGFLKVASWASKSFQFSAWMNAALIAR